MECRTARLLLDFARPRASELEAAEAEELQNHLAGCPECRALARAEHQADELLARAMRDVPLPPDGQARLQQRLDAARAALYRRWLARRARDAAVAAVLLLAAWLGYAHWAGGRRQVDVEKVTEAIDDLRGERREQLEQWFSQHYHIKTVLPGDFNYAFLVARSRQDFMGTAVPCLVFVRGTSFAEVLVLSGKQFDLPALPQQGGSGGVTIEIRPNPADPNFAYLILYNGNSLGWLITEAQPQVM